MDKIIVDAHCDTAAELFRTGCNLNINNLQVDLQRMRSVGNYVQFFAAFINAKKVNKGPFIDALKIVENFHLQVEGFNSFIEIAYKFSDISSIISKGKIAAIISVEGGEVIQGDLTLLRILYKLGVRSLCLTWNYRNEIGCGSGEDIDTGLLPFGTEVIGEMNRLGMIIDVSHSSENTFWGVLDYSKQPIIASHSNAKAICNHNRNLTDEQILALAKNGGVMGINFYPHFLKLSEGTSIEDVIRHIDYIASLVGTKHIGLGSDFDGIEITPQGLEDVSQVGKIMEELARRNYTQEQIDDIAGQNFLRVMKKILG